MFFMDSALPPSPDRFLAEALAVLVAAQTTSERPNQALVDWIAGDVADRADAVRIVATGRSDQFSQWMRFGPKRPGGVLLSGHLDVVPADPADWSVDPWAVTRRNGRLYGRGTCDMKGFVACVLAASQHWDADRLDRPIYLALSADEEIGSASLPALIADMKGEGVRPDAVIVGEPTGMDIVVGHKATYGARTTLRGRAAHSANPGRGRDANLTAARLVLFMAALQADLAVAEHHCLGFEPPHATLNAGIVRGGVARNVVSSEAIVEWDCRLMPDDDPDAVLRAVERFCSEDLGPKGSAAPGGATERLTFMPGLRPDPEGDALALARLACPDARTAMVSYATEAGFFQREGWSTVVLGPGSIDQAHRPDEYIEGAQLQACLAMLVALPRTMARAARLEVAR